MAGTKARTIGDIKQTRVNLAYIARWLAPTLDTLDLLADPLRGTDYDKAGGHGGVSDPTPALAEVHGRWIATHQEIHAHAAMLLTLTNLMVNQINAVPVTDHERDRRQWQCSGGLDRVEFEGWEQFCERYYEKRDGENAYLCESCVRRKNRHRQNQAELRSA